jgi:hypothetical protein
LSQPAELNSYVYAVNNAVNRFDPIGLLSQGTCDTGCKQSWAECYTNCINTLVSFDAFKTFIYSNLIANAGYYLSGGVTSITIGGEVIVIAESPIVLTGTAATTAAIIGEAALWTGAGIGAWVVGSSYGCMISCGINSCNY